MGFAPTPLNHVSRTCYRELPDGQRVEFEAGMNLPSLGQVARHAWPRLVEATIIPLLLFYLALWLVGRWAALSSALVWFAGGIGRRVVRGQPVPGVLLLGTVALGVRTVVAVASGSLFFYFLQPIVGTVAVALAFLVSVPLGNSLGVERLATDFCPLPTGVSERLQRLFGQLSVLWAALNLVTATVTLWLLVSQPLPMFVLGKTMASIAINATGVTLTVRWALDTARREGLALTPTPRPLTASSA